MCHLTIHFPNACNRQDWAGLNSGLRNVQARLCPWVAGNQIIELYLLRLRKPRWDPNTGITAAWDLGMQTRDLTCWVTMADLQTGVWNTSLRISAPSQPGGRRGVSGEVVRCGHLCLARTMNKNHRACGPKSLTRSAS